MLFITAVDELGRRVGTAHEHQHVNWWTFCLFDKRGEDVRREFQRVASISEVVKRLRAAGGVLLIASEVKDAVQITARIVAAIELER